MSREQLDMAVPISLEAASSYYRENMESILSSVSDTTTNSNNFENNQEFGDNCSISSTSTASDSDIEEQVQISNKTSTNKNNQSFSAAQGLKMIQQKSTDNEVNLHNKLQNINSVAITNSNDVHVGNKTFFNGPVTIKHIVLNSENNNNQNSNTKSFGAVNQGFEGSLNKLSQDDVSNKNVKPEDIHKVKSVEEQSSKLITNFFTRKKILTVTSALLILTTLAIVLVLILNKPEHKNEASELNIISRSEWGAKATNATLDDLILPLNRIIICHTVTKECLTKDECIENVKYIQNLHFGKDFNFSDIGYNFLIGGDGNVYEGRGWYKQGAHTSGYNRGSIGIAYIGNFVNAQPNDKQFSAGFALIAKGEELKIFTSNYTIFGASQLRDTQSPGKTFLERIKTWPHASQI